MHPNFKCIKIVHVKIFLKSNFFLYNLKCIVLIIVKKFEEILSNFMKKKIKYQSKKTTLQLMKLLDRQCVKRKISHRIPSMRTS